MRSRNTVEPEAPKRGGTRPENCSEAKGDAVPEAGGRGEAKTLRGRSPKRIVRTMTVLEPRNREAGNESGLFYEEVVAEYLPGYQNGTGSEGPTGKSGRFETDLHGNVNILLGGAMLSGVVIVVLLMCYCCHKSIRKRRPAEEYSPYWRTEPDAQSMEVFTTAATCYDRRPSQPEEIHGPGVQCPASPVPVGPGPPPPPAYDSLIFEAAEPDKKSDGPATIEAESILLRGSMDPPAVVEQPNAIDEDGLPTYEAALRLDADGYL